MTLATLLLALLTAANPSSDGGTSDAVLLDFHADWCVPCQRMRPAVDQLSRKGFPVKSINIDRAKAVADRYGVSAVPTFIVVDRSGRELDRTSGLQPAAELERFYLAARAKAQPPSQSSAHAVPRDDARADSSDDEDPPSRPVRRARRQQPHEGDRDGDEDREDAGDRPAKAFANPHPAATVVRIKVIGPHSTGFGSGTIISSSPEASLILTCATSSSWKAGPGRCRRASSRTGSRSTSSTAAWSSRPRGRPRSTTSSRSRAGRSTTISAGTSG